MDGRKFPRNVKEDQSWRERSGRERPHCVSPLFTFVSMFQSWHLSANACFHFITSVRFTECWTRHSFLGISVHQHLDIAHDQTISLSTKIENELFHPFHKTLLFAECEVRSGWRPSATSTVENPRLVLLKMCAPYESKAPFSAEGFDLSFIWHNWSDLPYLTLSDSELLENEFHTTSAKFCLHANHEERVFCKMPQVHTLTWFQ